MNTDELYAAVERLPDFRQLVPTEPMPLFACERCGCVVSAELVGVHRKRCHWGDLRDDFDTP